MFQAILNGLKKIVYADKDIRNACIDINMRRILFCAPIAAALNAFQVLIFSHTDTNASAAAVIWRHSLSIINGVFFACMLVCFFSALIMRRRTFRPIFALLLQYFTATTLTIGGIAVVTIDQLVTTNITPFIIINLIVGAMLLLHPLYSAIHFAVSYAIYYFAIAVYAPSAEILLSNHVNGLAAVAFGFALSITMWRHYYITFSQRKHIIDQQKNLEEANRNLEKMAFYDSLTGLPNRRHFDQLLQKEISRNSRKGFESYLIMLDIDLFKRINDIYGHPIGDALLIDISKLLLSNIRRYDTICRLGGEEFLLLLPQTDADESLVVAEKLRGLLESHTFCIKDNLIRITASFGVARLAYTSDPHLIAQYAKVDNALYIAKQSGRNCVKIA